MAATEQKKSYEVVKNFKGVNTKANRTAIDKDEFSWLENAMPIGYANLKIVPTYTTANVTFANTVTTLTSCNINNEDLVLGFCQDGRAEAINVTNYTKSNVAVTGTFSNNGINVTQWKSERALIADPYKGVYSWDGTNLVSIGSVGSIAITKAGSGYTSTPAIIISAPNETGGLQATAQATVTANAVTFITLTEAGSGYTSPPTITITGGGSSNAATAIASLSTFKTGTVSVLVTNGGTGFTNAANTTVTFAGGGGANAAGTAILLGGQVARVIMTTPTTQTLPLRLQVGEEVMPQLKQSFLQTRFLELKHSQGELGLVREERLLILLLVATATLQAFLLAHLL